LRDYRLALSYRCEEGRVIAAACFRQIFDEHRERLGSGERALIVHCLVSKLAPESAQQAGS
jgi:hypothetical protein